LVQQLVDFLLRLALQLKNPALDGSHLQSQVFSEEPLGTLEQVEQVIFVDDVESCLLGETVAFAEHDPGNEGDGDFGSIGEVLQNNFEELLIITLHSLQNSQQLVRVPGSPQRLIGLQNVHHHGLGSRAGKQLGESQAISIDEAEVFGGEHIGQLPQRPNL
jgi:hypothetical protein